MKCWKLQLAQLSFLNPIITWEDADDGPAADQGSVVVSETECTAAKFISKLTSIIL